MKIVWVALFLSAHCELTLSLFRKHIYNSTLMTWSDAQKFCRDNYVDLSTIDSEEELTRFKNDSVAQGGTTESWVGLSKPSANGQWVWSDGSKESFIKWQSYPKSPDTEFCAKTTSGLLRDGLCNEKKPFFCYKWVPELIVVTEKKSWEEALEHCRTKHSDLACLPTSLHLLQVQNKTPVIQTPSVWTGLRFLSGSWFWVSGESLGNLFQLPKCPANALYCGSRNLKAESWENRDCSEKLNFVCY